MQPIGEEPLTRYLLNLNGLILLLKLITLHWQSKLARAVNAVL
jgi:hypothetical protein